MNVGYVGLGALGHALAGRLLAQHTLTVWDLNPGAMQAMARRGAVPAASPAALASACEVVILCLPRSTDVHELLFGSGRLVEGLSPGKLIIDQTSGVPTETQEMAARLADRGIAMMDAAVSGSPHIVAAGGATLMVAGPETTQARALPLLHEISSTVLMCGTR